MAERRPLVFLHTAEAHVGTFSALMAELAPDVPVRHAVDPELLAEAVAAGGISPGLAARVGTWMREAAETAAVVVCTCSTLGGVAESAGPIGPVPVCRVDRAMAEAAIAAGSRILVVAAVASTLGPTTELLAAVGAERQRSPALDVMLLADAWPLFLAGDLERYLALIAERVRARLAERPADAVVLAQASMAGAAAPLADLGVPVLASPRLGAEAAVRAWRAATEA